jgi:hypothetical protein
MHRSSLFFFLLLLPALSFAQRGLVRWAYGAFATPGDAAYVVEGNRIHQAAGPFGDRGPCIYLFDLGEEQVFHSADQFGRRGMGAFFTEGTHLIRCSGNLCARGPCALIVEGNRIFRSQSPACFRGDGAFVLENNVVYLADGPFGSKGDALFAVEGDVPLLALLAILAGY